MARLLIDMDGVLCDLVGKWFAAYNREHGESLRIEHMREWGPHLYAREGKKIYHFLSRPGFLRDLEPLPGAIAGVHRLLEWGHEVVIVTATKGAHRDKLSWVRQYLPVLGHENVVFAHRKELVRGELLFDDAPHNLAAFAPYGLPVAMAYPYNENAPGERVSSWAEFLDLVTRRWPTEGPHSDGRETTEVLRLGIRNFASGAGADGDRLLEGARNGNQRPGDRSPISSSRP